MVDIDEFIDYYESLSLMIIEDDIFKEVILKSWGLMPLNEKIKKEEKEVKEEEVKVTKEEPKENIEKKEALFFISGFISSFLFSSLI